MIVKKIINMVIISIFSIFILFQSAFAESHIQISSHAKDSNGFALSETVIDFVITDPQGRRLGRDPRIENFTESFYNEFEIGYGTEGIDDLSHAEASIKPIDGVYTVEVFGEDLMSFSINISVRRNLSGNGKNIGFKTLELTQEQTAAVKKGVVDFSFESIIDKNLTSKFQFTYNSDPAKSIGTATKIVTPSILKQDVILSRKIGWIDSDGIMKSLLAKADAIEASIAKGSKTAAKNQLNAFIKEVNAQKGKHISDKAVKILLEDAQYIMESLSK